jgi:hypothetical protein
MFINVGVTGPLSQVLFEDDTVNRVEEALNLFEEVCGFHWFNRAAMILFLNKRDLFREKVTRPAAHPSLYVMAAHMRALTQLKVKPLTMCEALHDYNGPPVGEEAYEPACEFVKVRLLETALCSRQPSQRWRAEGISFPGEGLQDCVCARHMCNRHVQRQGRV